MRIFPIALIVIGSLGVARHLGLIPIGMLHFIGPLMLIAFGVALLLRRPYRCRDNRRDRHRDESTNTPPPSPGLI